MNSTKFKHLSLGTLWGCQYAKFPCSCQFDRTCWSQHCFTERGCADLKKRKERGNKLISRGGLFLHLLLLRATVNLQFIRIEVWDWIKSWMSLTSKLSHQEADGFRLCINITTYLCMRGRPAHSEHVPVEMCFCSCLKHEWIRSFEFKSLHKCRQNEHQNALKGSFRWIYWSPVHLRIQKNTNFMLYWCQESFWAADLKNLFHYLQPEQSHLRCYMIQ